MDAFLIEAELLLDWYLPRLDAAVPDDRARLVPRAVARAAAAGASTRRRPGCCATSIRPICSGCRERSGNARARHARLPGRRDGAGAPTISPRCCRTRAWTCPNRLRSRCSAATCADAAGTDPTSMPPQFIRLYVTLAAQRASKILGIFARLDMRDGKPQYLRHMPRVWGYSAALARPSRAGVAQCLVYCPRAVVKHNLSAQRQNRFNG